MARGKAAPRARSWLALSTSLWLCPALASAQERDPAVAQALFDQGVELARQGKYVEACPKLLESNRLDPGHLGTQYHLANCYEQTGRVASAWVLFLDVASQASASGQVDREKAARERAAKLGPRLPRLILNVPEASKTPGLEVRRNGVLVGTAQWGAAVPADPGEVELTASAPGHQTLRQTLLLEEGKTATYSLPELVAAPAAPVDETAAAPPATPPQPVAPPPTVAASPSSAPSPAAHGPNGPWIITLGGVGLVAVGIGSAYTALALTKYAESKDECDTDNVNRCSPSGIQMRSDARTRGDIATVSFIVGGAALVGAGIVWFATGSSNDKHTATNGKLRATPIVGNDRAALLVQGSF